jgi:hypothetical protein
VSRAPSDFGPVVTLSRIILVVTNLVPAASAKQMQAQPFAFDGTLGRAASGQVYPFDPAGMRGPSYFKGRRTAASPLRERMIEDMTLGGLP